VAGIAYIQCFRVKETARRLGYNIESETGHLLAELCDQKKKKKFNILIFSE
jgi:hypothetical protein